VQCFEASAPLADADDDGDDDLPHRCRILKLRPLLADVLMMRMLKLMLKLVLKRMLKLMLMLKLLLKLMLKLMQKLMPKLMLAKK